MNMRNIFFLSLTMLFFSCQDVIELELNETITKPVIVSNISTELTDVEVVISRSLDFYDSSIPSKLSGGIVTISDESGITYNLLEESPGLYKSMDLTSGLGVSYTLNVDIEGENYSAIASIPTDRVLIDSIELKYREESIFFKEGIYPIVHYSDPSMDENYYRFKAKVNGEVFDYTWDDEGEDPDLATEIQLYNDKFSNIGPQEFDIFYHLKKGDVLEVELQHLDQKTYDYLRTLAEVGSGVGVAPSDPISNFGDAALGYFGAYTSSIYTIVVD